MADFIPSLAESRGPVGEQVRTYLAGDGPQGQAEQVRRRIKGLKAPSDYEYRHAAGRDIPESLCFIVDSIERLIAPDDPKVAFDLLVRTFEADGVAMDCCGEHHWEVRCAYGQAARALGALVPKLPRDTTAAVIREVRRLINHDAYGTRKDLTGVLRTLSPQPGL